MIKLLHWCALRISDLGEAIFNLGGNLEAWCDEKHWAQVARRVAKQQTVKGEAIKAWLAVPLPSRTSLYEFDPKEQDQ